MKATRATLKSFVRKNEGNLLFSSRSSFDGMIDGCASTADKSFKPATKSDLKHADGNTLGIAGVWLVGGGRDSIIPFNKDGLTGLEVYNCCGHFLLAVKG